MRIITQVLAMEVKLRLVVSISQADFKNAQSSKDVAQDAVAPVHAKYGELQAARRVPEFGNPAQEPSIRGRKADNVRPSRLTEIPDQYSRRVIICTFLEVR